MNIDVVSIKLIPFIEIFCGFVEIIALSSFFMKFPNGRYSGSPYPIILNGLATKIFLKISECSRAYLVCLSLLTP